MEKHPSKLKYIFLLIILIAFGIGVTALLAYRAYSTEIFFELSNSM